MVLIRVGSLFISLFDLHPFACLSRLQNGIHHVLVCLAVENCGRHSVADPIEDIGKDCIWSL